MDAELQAVADALSELADAELRALIDAANELVLFAASLLSWVEHLADWEINRRGGLDFPLQPPHAVIPPEEHLASVAGAAMLRARFADTPREAQSGVVGLFDAVANALAGNEAAPPKDWADLHVPRRLTPKAILRCRSCDRNLDHHPRHAQARCIAPGCELFEQWMPHPR